MQTPDVQERGSDRMPTFAHARVSDVMHRGVMSVPPETDLVTVARMMATHHIHAVVVTGVEQEADTGERFFWSLLSDVDLVGAAAHMDTAEAGQVAGTEIIAIEPGESLERAAQTMVEHQVSHLIVVDPQTRMPIGVLSTLDIAGALAWGEV